MVPPQPCAPVPQTNCTSTVPSGRRGRDVLATFSTDSNTVPVAVVSPLGSKQASNSNTGLQRITPVELDITVEAHVARLDELLPERLDGVVNNAGIGVGGPIQTVSLDDVRQQLEVNVVGQIAVTRQRCQGSAGPEASSCSSPR
jgi:NAD(P)-dependent dehydrogenase (short-subunit alcohol dehydrogenase family)